MAEIEQAAADGLAADAVVHAKVIKAARAHQAKRTEHPELPFRGFAAAERVAHFLCNSRNTDARQSKNCTGDTPGCAQLRSVDAAGPNGLTPLLVACLKGNVADVDALLAYGADPRVEGLVWDSTQIPHTTESCKEFPLSIAAREGHTKIAELLLAHTLSDVNQASSDTGTTALYVAGSAGKVDVARLLLAKKGIAVNQGMTDGGATPLYIACYFGHTNVAALLLQQQGIAINQGRTEDGATPLYTACYSGFLNCIRMLLARPEIDVNKSMLDGDTPLYAACFSGDTATVWMLLQHSDLDVNKARSDDGANPLYIACDKGHVDIVRLLLADGRADLNHKNLADGLTPLHAAAFNDRLLVAQLLVFHGASTTPADNEGDTPEDLAAMENYEKMVEWLQAIAEWTPLRVAAACRLHTDASVALRLGLIDPDANGPAEAFHCIGFSQMPPKFLPWRDPKPLCMRTIKMVNDATRGWHRTTHWLHHAELRRAVFTVVVVAGRLERNDTQPPLSVPHDQNPVLHAANAEASRSEQQQQQQQQQELPALPIEMWMAIMLFFMRSWWKVKKSSVDFHK